MSSDFRFNIERPRIHPPLPKDIEGNPFATTSTMNADETIDYIYNTRHRIEDPSRLKPGNFYLLFDNDTLDYPLLLFVRCDGHTNGKKKKVIFTVHAYTASEEHIEFSFNNWIPIDKDHRGQIEISYVDVQSPDTSRYHIFETHAVIGRRLPYLMLSEGLQYPKEHKTFATIRERYLMNPEIMKEVSLFMPSAVDIKKKKKSRKRARSKSPKSGSNSPSRKRIRTAGGKKRLTAKNTTRKYIK
jgi:hypothetical protein